jgi:acid phosphatase
MGNPRTKPSVFGGSWISILIPVLGIAFLYRFISQEYFNMRTNPRASFMAAVAASLMRYSKADSTVDLGWYAPKSTEINNLTQVIGGSSIYGWIYNSSQVPDNEYGVYNWCNMPHVRATEYPKASSEYTLQYVEVVC